MNKLEKAFMRNWLIIILFTVIMSISWLNCGNSIISESSDGFNKINYNKIHVGWLHLEDALWKENDYDNKEQWVAQIKHCNIEILQTTLKKSLAGKTVMGYTDKKGPEAANDSLYIKFDSAEFDEFDQLTVSVEFIDKKSGKIVYSADTKSDSSSTVPFTGTNDKVRIERTFQKLAESLAEKLK